MLQLISILDIVKKIKKEKKKDQEVVIYGNEDYEIEELIQIHMIILNMNIQGIYPEVKVIQKRN